MCFPVRTFPFILLWQERKEERALLKPTATSKQHHYVSFFFSFIFFLQQKIPIATSSVYFMEMKMHPHFNNKADNASTSLCVCHRVVNIDNQSVQWGLWVFSRSANKPRTLISFGFFSEYERRWTECVSVLQLRCLG